MNIRNVTNISKFTIFHFQQELDIKSHIEKKLKFTEEEKHRVECRLKNTELELKETETSLEQSNSKRKVSWKLRERIEYQNWKQPYPTQPPLSPLPPPKKKKWRNKVLCSSLTKCTAKRPWWSCSFHFSLLPAEATLLTVWHGYSILYSLRTRDISYFVGTKIFRFKW